MVRNRRATYCPAIVSPSNPFTERSSGHTEITGATRLVDDLGCSSIDIISLVVAIEEAYGTRKLGFAELLIREGQYVSDLEIAELARFVAGKLQTTGALSPRPIGRI